MRAESLRRPEFGLLAALVLLGGVLLIRWINPVPPVQIAINAGEAPPAPIVPGSEQQIAQLQARLRLDPDDTQAYTELGHAMLQRVRETADPSLYALAGQAFYEALKRDPQQLDALIGQGSLALSRHDFAAALDWGQQAQALNPRRALTYGIMADAQIELGRYADADTTLQTMVNTRPDLSSYSRISYFRELHGETAGAIEAMKLAVAAGGPAEENTLWTQVQLGNLYFNSGDLIQAEATYNAVLRIRSDYAYAQAGIAQVQAARGEYAEAIALYQQITNRLPLPQFIIALGDLYAVTGKPDQAQTQYDLVRAIQQLNSSAGVNVDMEMALFNAEYGTDPAQAVSQAKAAYALRPSIYGADALAWALYQDGQYPEAWRYSQEALTLGTRDALLHFHAGTIAHALGDDAAAREHLQTALAINPHFSVRHTAQVQELLQQLR